MRSSEFSKHAQKLNNVLPDRTGQNNFKKEMIGSHQVWHEKSDLVQLYMIIWLIMSEIFCHNTNVFNE